MVKNILTMNRKNLIMNTSASNIRELVLPLKRFGIHYFSMIRVLPDNSHFSLITHPVTSEHYIEREYYKMGSLCGDFDSYRSGLSLWSTMQSFEYFRDLRESFKIDHGIIVVKKYAEYCDFYYFASTPDNHKVVNFYINNFHILEAFIQSFLDKGDKLIKASEQDKAIYPMQFQRDDLLLDSLESFRLNEMSPLLEGFTEKQFTKRELECAYFICKGYSAKEIGQRLYLSHRTVEKYIASLKAKTGMNSTKQFIVSFGRYFLFHFCHDEKLK